VTGETEVALTEEFEMMSAPARGAAADDPDGLAPAVLELTAEGDPGEEVPPPAMRAQHGARERGYARELFERLAQLPPGDEERLRIRGELVELHLPLVEYLARRFRNRGEWLDDLTQVATIGLIKSIDRFDLERGVEFSTYATPTIVGEIKRHFRDKGRFVRVE
jgi:RNA polymerase sigma-B factor